MRNCPKEDAGAFGMFNPIGITVFVPFAIVIFLLTRQSGHIATRTECFTFISVVKKNTTELWT